MCLCVGNDVSMKLLRKVTCLEDRIVTIEGKYNFIKAGEIICLLGIAITQKTETMFNLSLIHI